MPLFQASSLTFAQAKVKIARAASAESDTDMLTKAGDALESAFQTWNNRRHWSFLKDTHTFATVVPISVVSCTTTSESTAVTSPSLSSVVAGDVVSGTGIRAETYVISVDLAAVPDALVLSQPASAAGTVTLTFARRDYLAPTNFKYIYNMRIPASGMTVYPIDSRLLDRISPDQLTQSTPLVYDPHPLGADGKIRFFPTPNARYMIEAKYYRRMTVPSVDGTALDIPIDFEWGVLAEAKSIFLTDKGGYDGQAAFWAAKSADALASAILADKKHPDELASFLPGSTVGGLGRGADTIANTDSGWGSNYGDDYGG